jgi:hypothetical protein
MFDGAGFTKLYQLLSGEMVDVDCGIQCQKHCCNHNTRYLLPGELKFLHASGVAAAFKPIDHLYFTSFDRAEGHGCACDQLRELRPFNCRIFPFRPRFENGEVVGIKKARGPAFLPCWVEQPLPSWGEAATEAWRLVLADRDNALFYAKLNALTELVSREKQGGAEPTMVETEQKLASLYRLEPAALLAEVEKLFTRE